MGRDGVESDRDRALVGEAVGVLIDDAFRSCDCVALAGFCDLLESRNLSFSIASRAERA